MLRLVATAVRTAAIFATMLFVGCAAVQTHSELDRATGSGYASVGDVVLRVNRTDDLPNAFGRADVFGRKRDRGFSELRYMGVNAEGCAVFRRRDIEIYSNETTMSQSGLQFATATAQRNGNSASISGVSFSAPQAVAEPLPPDTTEFVVQPGPRQTVTMSNHGITISKYDKSGIAYEVW